MEICRRYFKHSTRHSHTVLWSCGNNLSKQTKKLSVNWRSRWNGFIVKKMAVVWLEISEPSSKLCHDLELFFLRYFHAHIVTINHRRRPTRFRATTLHCIQLRTEVARANMEKGASRESTLIDWMPRESASCCRTEIKFFIHKKSSNRLCVSFNGKSNIVELRISVHPTDTQMFLFHAFDHGCPRSTVPNRNNIWSQRAQFANERLAIISSTDSSIHSRYNCIICLISLIFVMFLFCVDCITTGGQQNSTQTHAARA